MIMNNFEELKAEIIRRGYEANACHVIHDAEDADTMEAFFDVVKDNFNWCFYKGVVDVPMIEANKELFNAVHIYANEVHHEGYCLIDGDIDTISVLANIYVCGNATIKEVCGNATIKEVYGKATVKEVCDNATVNYVGGNATINKVCDNATVNYVCSNATVKEVYGNATINKVCDNATVKEVCDYATVKEVYGNATVNSWLYIPCDIRGNAVLRVISTNTLYTRMNVEILN